MKKDTQKTPQQEPPVPGGPETSGETLQDPEPRFRDLVENIIEPIYVIDHKGIFTFVSPPIFEYSGYTPEAMIGKPFLSFIDPDDHDRIRSRYQDALSGIRHPDDYRFVCKGGQVKWFHTASRQLLEQGRPIGIQGTIRDVTELKKAEQSLRESNESIRKVTERLRLATHAANVGIWELDLVRHAMIWDDILYGLYGVTRGRYPDPNDAYRAGLHPDDVARKDAEHHRALSGEKDYDTEFRVIWPDGSIHTLKASGTVIRDAEGKPVRMLGTNWDITAQKNAQSEIEDLYHHAPCGYHSLGPDGTFLRINDRELEWLGYTRDEVVGKMTFAEVVTRASAEQFNATFPVLKEKGEMNDLIVEMVRKDRTVFTGLLNASVIRGPDGQFLMSRSTLFNITQRKKAEDARRSSEERLKIIFESAPDAYYLNDLKGTFLDGNRASERLTGYRKEELIGKNFLQLHLLPAGQLPKATAMLARNIAGQSTGPDEFELVRKDGSKVAVEISTHPVKIDGRSVILGIARDITERIKSEEDVRLKEKYLDSSTDSILVHDLEGRMIFANQAAWETLGYAQEEFMALDLRRLNVPAYAEMVGERLKQLQEEEMVVFETVHLHKTGRKIPVEVNGRTMELSGRTIIISSVRDISKRKQAELVLKASQESFINIVERGPNGLIIAGPDDRVLFANENSRRFTGIREGQSLTEVFGRPLQPGAIFEVPITRLTGERSTGEVRIVETSWERRPALLAVVIDITRSLQAIAEKDKAEERLRQAQKLEEMGRLAGGVAHDFNNILTAILGYAELLQAKMPAGDPYRRYIEEIQKAGQRAAGLTRQLLTLGRRQHIKLQAVDLAALVRDMLVMLKSLAGERVRFRTDLPEGLPMVLADRGQMEQVLMNLVVNARDAMPDGGEIALTLRAGPLDAGGAAEGPQASSGWTVCLCAADTGRGMTADVLEHIFEPFYSTKKEGEGTGLGLSVVYSIVKQHHGSVTVESVPGKGTIFHVCLPVSEGVPAPGNAEDEPLMRMEGRGRRLLLVEDEAGIRKFADMVLTERGYRVASAADAEAALVLFEKENGAFDLVFSDVIMPGKSGVDLVEALREKKPGLGVVLASGYARDRFNYDKIQERGYRFLKKPYTLKELLSAIQAEADRAAGQGAGA